MIHVAALARAFQDVRAPYMRKQEAERRAPVKKEEEPVQDKPSEPIEEAPVE